MFGVISIYLLIWINCAFSFLLNHGTVSPDCRYALARVIQLGVSSLPRYRLDMEHTTDTHGHPRYTAAAASTTQTRAGAAEPSALLRGLAHGIFLSALIWAALGWIFTLLR
jgi:hypothetical protein